MISIVIAKVTAYDPAIPGERTLYYATQGYVSKPTDTPANTYYAPRIKQPADISRACFSAGRTSGATTVGFGELELVNIDGGLDELLGLSFAGRKIEITVGTITPDTTTPTWTTLIIGTMDQPQVSWSSIRVLIRDRQQDLTQPLQSNLYGGTNSLPAGVDGVVSDLKSKRKPMVFGQVTNIAPPCVNTSRLIYQINDGAVSAIGAVYDRGVTLTAGATYASQADMETTAPAAGQYRAWLTGGMFRLGSSPSGTVTADVTQGATAADRTAAQVMKSVLLKSGISSGDISSADVTALDTACNYQVGVYVPHGNDATGAATLDFIANSIGAFWGVDRLGVFRMARITTPSSPIGYLTSINIISIDRIPGNDSAGIPAWKVTVGYGKNYSPTDDLAGSVTLAERNRLREEYRAETYSNSAVKTANLYSPEMRFDTGLVSASDAAIEASRLQSLYGTRRDMYLVRVRIDAELVSVIDLGKSINVTLPRYDMASGKNFLIVGIRTDMRNNIFDLTLWG